MPKNTEIHILKRLGLHKSESGIEIIRDLFNSEIRVKHAMLVVIIMVLVFLSYLIVFKDDLQWPSVLFQNIVMVFLGFVVGSRYGNSYYD